MPDTYEISKPTAQSIVCLVGTLIMAVTAITGVFTPFEDTVGPMIKIAATFFGVVGMAMVIISVHVMSKDCNSYCKNEKGITCDGNCGSEVLKIGVYVTGIICMMLVIFIAAWTPFEDTVTGKAICSILIAIAIVFLLILSLNVGGILCNCSSSCTSDVKYGFLSFSIIASILMGFMMAFTPVEDTTYGKIISITVVTIAMLPTIFYMVGCKDDGGNLSVQSCMNFDNCSCLT